MRIGCTTDFADASRIEAIAKAGYDYVEISLNRFTFADDEVYRNLLSYLDRAGIPCETANCLFPGDIKLCGEQYDPAKVKEYLTKAFERIRGVGIDVIVFGSGTSRKIPDGFPREKAMEQLRDVCAGILEPLCDKYGVRIAIEPLRSEETNVFNTVSEVNSFVKEIALPHVKCLADNYHMAQENEPYTDIRAVGEDLIHAHIANPDGRWCPTLADSHDYSEFFASLKAIGYTGRLSVEAGIPKDVPEYLAIADTAKFLRACIL